MSSVAWKYAARLDDSSPKQTATDIAKMLDYWTHGPYTFVNKFSTLESANNNGRTHSPVAPVAGSATGPATTTSPLTANPDAKQLQYRSPVAANYVIFSCADGQRYLVSHSVARMCDSLVDILDELDLQNADEEFDDESKRLNLLADADESPAAINRQIEAVTEDCALLEVAIASLALESVVVYLALAVEHGATSTIPYPLTGLISSGTSSIDSLIQPWEAMFLQDYTPLQVTLSQGGSSSNSPAGTSLSGKCHVAFAPFSSASSDAAALLQASNVTPGGATVNATTGAAPVIFCPPLISALRAADYLGINSLRDLSCASLAMKILSVKDENILASLLGLPKLPSESDLEDVYARFPFLIPTRFVGGASATAGGVKNEGGANSGTSNHNHNAPTA